MKNLYSQAGSQLAFIVPEILSLDENKVNEFFNENAEDEGIKITGPYPYEVYEQILEEMLSEQPIKNQPPPIENFLKYFKVVASMEIAVVYNMSISQVEREMKKLILLKGLICL